MIALPSLASAQKVAVLPINGPQGVKAHAEIVKVLRKKYDLVPESAWDEAAKRLVATTRSAGDISAVATDLGVQVVITGTIKRDGGWVLIVNARNGPSGKTTQKLKYPLRGPRLDPGTMRQLAQEIGPAVEAAAAGSPAGAEEEAPTAEQPPAATTVPEDQENPLAEKKAPPPAAAPTIERPAWTPWIDASVGFVLSGRNFAFDQSGLPQFHSSVAPGLRIDATGYPLALLATRPGAGINAITGLGVGVTFDYIFWPDSIPCTRDGSGNCISTMERYGTSEYRLEAGLRWHWNFLNAPMRPDLRVELQYGLHDFSIQKKPDGSDVGPPDVTYSYFTIGVGIRYPFIERLAAFAGFNFHILFDSGSIQSAAEFGPGGGYGFRAHLGLEVKIWKGLLARAAGFFEQFGLSFDGGGGAAKSTTGGATDMFYGAIISVGYIY